MAAGTLELQQALSTGAELNTLLYETGSARTLSLARNSAGLYWIGSIMAFYRRSVSPWLRGLYPFVALPRGCLRQQRLRDGTADRVCSGNDPCESEEREGRGGDIVGDCDPGRYPRRRGEVVDHGIR